MSPLALLTSDSDFLMEWFMRQTDYSPQNPYFPIWVGPAEGGREECATQGCA